MTREQIRRLAETGVALALGVVLHQFVFYQLPQGGRITAGSMVPVFYIALRWGADWGILSGFVYGLLVYILEPIYVHPVQWALDYPVAFGAIGLAGLFSRLPAAGVVLGGVVRLISHYLSGVVFFAQFAPKGQSPWIYSALYNGSYMLPEIIISVMLTVLVLRSLKRLEPAMR